MAADVTAKAWQTTARQLANDLPGNWRIGRTGIRTLLIRIRDHWIIDWFGLDRVRRDSPPRLMGGLTPLTALFINVAIHCGYSGSFRPGFPDRIDLSDPQAGNLIDEFTTAVLDKIDPWTPQRLADEAEAELNRPAEERLGPLSFPYAAGWRVVLNTGSPVDPATEAADWFDHALAPDDAVWYRSLITAWQDGGRPTALTFLEDQRTQALASLKLK